MTIKTKAAGALLFGVLVLALLASATATNFFGRRSPNSPASLTRERVAENYGKIPMSFEANEGQADARVKFIARGSGYNLYLMPTEAVLILGEGAAVPAGRPDREPTTAGLSALRMKLLGANEDTEVSGLGPQPASVNYLIGDDPREWRTDVPTYRQVQYKDVYRGVDLVYYGAQRQLEYDFVVEPGADPNQIRLRFEGAKTVRIDETGDLLLTTEGGEVRQRKPVVYQDAPGGRSEVEGSYVLKGTQEVGFEIGDYDGGRPLVIDPILNYSTYLGGTEEEFARGLAVDAAGGVYLSGHTLSAGFPTTAGAYDTSLNGGGDIFVTKLDPTGTSLVYSTYLGGSGNDLFGDVVVDAAGNAYLTGLTVSGDFPTTPGAFDAGANGGPDVFAAKLDPTGSALIHSTYLGGSDFDMVHGIAVDAGGNTYLAGETFSFNFPTTPGALDATLSGVRDAFVTKLDASGGSLVYSTYLGGSGNDVANHVAVDAVGSAYLIGWTFSTNFPTTPGAFDTTANGSNEMFVAKLDPAGAALTYSTYIGGSAVDVGEGIAIDAAGYAYLVGGTQSNDFPTTPGAFDTTANGQQDVAVMKLDPTGSSLVYSTYLGGTADEHLDRVAPDADGNAYLAGLTLSVNFPTTPGAFDTTANGSVDIFVAKLGAGGGSLLYSTYLGGSQDDVPLRVAVDDDRNVYLTGYTASADFPTFNALQPDSGGDRDAFVVKITLSEAPSPTPTPTLTPTPSPSPAPTPTPGVGPPTDKDQCKDEGWRTFDVPRAFQNQGDCIQFVLTGK